MLSTKERPTYSHSSRCVRLILFVVGCWRLVFPMHSHADLQNAFAFYKCYLVLFVVLCFAETAMGKSANAQENRDSDYVKAIYE